MEKKSNRLVTGVILAAGRSSRMGGQKLLLPWGNTTIIGQVLDNALESGLDDVLLVSGSDHLLVEAEAISRGVRTVYNHNYEHGQSSSIRAGIAALPPGHGALFILGDQPQVNSAILSKMAEAYRGGNSEVLAPRGEDERRGNPVLMSPLLFPELATLEGDVGGQPVLRRHMAEIEYVDVGGKEVLMDIDTPEQYQEMTAGGKS